MTEVFFSWSRTN